MDIIPQVSPHWALSGPMFSWCDSSRVCNPGAQSSRVRSDLEATYSMRTKAWCGVLIPAMLTLMTTYSSAETQKDLVDYVNPYIGHISHLLRPTSPTVSLPNSILRIWPSRGNFASPTVHGLSLIQTAHTGGPAFDLSPFVGETHAVGAYHWDQEKVHPNFYSVFLQEPEVSVSFAPSHQSAIYRLTFEKAGARKLVFHTAYGALNYGADGTVSGYRILGKAKLFLYAVLSTAATKTETLPGDEVALALDFGTTPKNVSVRYGVSYISLEQAKKNLQREIPDFDLDKVANKGRRIWNQALGKIQVGHGSENDKAAMYTALYRTYERMVNLSEDGHYYSGFNNQVHDDGGVPFYNDDWSWDTFRAAHPLHGLINPEIEGAKVASYVRMGQQSPEGWMPTFPQLEGDSHLMNGNHYVSIVWDGYKNGLNHIDLATAYEHCKATVLGTSMAPWMREKPNRLDAFYWEHGYYPALNPGEKETVPGVHGSERRQAVAVSLAASYDTWCLAQMAKELGKTEDYKRFLACSRNYRNLFNPETGFFHPKNEAGQFIQPFDYRFSGGMGARDFYDENNGWTYRWDVQHNVGDLVRLMGGPERFVKNLDQLFAEGLGTSRYDFYSKQPDSTGNVGQFVMGNEPSLHIPYLYNYAGAPWKTQQRVRSLLEMWFRNDLMGVPGDEDGGGLSGFVVFSSIGFYPVTPGTATYNIGSPLFDHIAVDLGNGKKFEIIAKGCSKENKYIQSAKLNGEVWNRPWFPHAAIANGGKLELVMGDRPNKSWGADASATPPSSNDLDGE